MNQCVGIKNDGIVCGKSCANREIRCRTHRNVILKHGPNLTAQRELIFSFKKIISDEQARVGAIILRDNEGQRFHIENLRIFIQRQKINEREALLNLRREQAAEMLRTGIDPDAPARQRMVEERDRNAAIWRERMLAAAVERDRLMAMVAPIEPVVRPQPVQRDLRHFAADPQNVHTTEAVRQTKEIVERIRKVPVPEDYRWHPVNASKTPFEIGMHCKLTQRAAWQMISQYAQTTSIYEIEEGIYGKVLDSVWQYVKNSSDKEDLCKVIKQEMEDNVGMCAQGNLSRICNVLAGYMEGIGPQESLAERLGHLFSALMSMDDVYQRLVAAHMILRENMVPEAEWPAWLDPLHD